MKRSLVALFALSAIVIVVASVFAVNARGTIKEPAVAGAFYPADKQSLIGMVNGFLTKADFSPVDGKLIALIAPHAGYEFSGQVAAYAYRRLKERDVDTVVLIGPSHYASFSGVAVYTGGGMKTPLGTVKVNTRIAKSLIDERAQVSADPAAFDKEHSLEVQLPFLQTALKEFTIVPVLIGQPTRASFDSLTRRLETVLRKNKNAIILASTDLSHYHDDGAARTMDAKVIDAVSRMSVEDLEQLLSSGEGEMCGGYPVIFTMAVARKLGATNGVLYRYANSGDVTHDTSRVVGYAAMGIYKAPLTSGQRNELLSLAKRTIDSYVKRGAMPDYSAKDPRLTANGATFVTINRNGALRGCIGNIEPMMPLYRSVMRNAVAACSQDPRFPPMNREELNGLDIEVTVLSPLEPLADARDIVIGTHGLYIVKGMNSGILLPQVAEEYKWDVPTFLEQVSVKAGLPQDGWKKDAQIYTFTADIIK